MMKNYRFHLDKLKLNTVLGILLAFTEIFSGSNNFIFIKFITYFSTNFLILSLFSKLNIVLFKIILFIILIITAVTLHLKVAIGLDIGYDTIVSFLNVNRSDTIGYTGVFIVPLTIYLTTIISFVAVIKVVKSKQNYPSLIPLIMTFNIIVSMIYCQKAYQVNIFSHYKNTLPVRFFFNYAKYLYDVSKYRIYYNKKKNNIITYNNDINKYYNSELPVNVVLIIGESARYDKLSINGYSRNTNPKLSQIKKDNIITFENVKSCSTATAVSIPCLLSKNGKDVLNINGNVSIIEMFNQAGFRTYFYSMQDIANSTAVVDICKDANVCSINIKGYDNKLSEILVNTLKDTQYKKKLIILHQQGSHSKYYDKYPQEFEHFSPVCKEYFGMNCKDKDINAHNVYDNTIRYSDFVINNIFQALNDTNAILLYTSDHGESLGEGGRYGHSSEYESAPSEQTKVPFIVMFSNQFIQNKTNSNIIDFFKSIRKKNISHSDIFYILSSLRLKHSAN